MGVSSSLQLFCWFAEYFAIMFCVVCLMTVALTQPVEISTVTHTGLKNVPYYSAILGRNDPSVLFCFLIAYSLSVITFSFAVSACFSKGKLTGVHDRTLVNGQIRLGGRKYSRSQTTVKELNKLSADCVRSSSIDMFKNMIDKYLVTAGCSYRFIHVDSRYANIFLVRSHLS